MVDTERLDAVISVIDDFSPEIDELIADLGVADRALSRVDDRTIDADVHDAELDAYIAKLATAAALGAAAGADMNVGGRGGGAAGAAAVDDAADSMQTFDLRMSDMHNALAKLVPLIFVIVGALPAIIGALVGLAAAAVAAAAALAGLAGLAALGLAMQRGDGDVMAGMQDILEEVQEDFLDAFRPLAEQLAPLMEDALDGLGKFFQELADRGQVLVEFSNAARDFGQFLLRTLPDAIANAGRVAQAFAPTFGALASTIGEMDILEEFMTFMANVLPTFDMFIRLLASILAPIGNMSVGFLQVVNALLGFLSVLFRVMSILPITEKQIGFIVAGLLSLVTVIAILNSSIVATLIPSMASLGSMMLSVLASASAAAGGITILDKAIMLATASTWRLAAAAAVATAGLSVILGLASVAATQWFTMSTGIQDATSSLREFDRVAGRTEGRNPFGADPPDRDRVVGGGSGGGGDTVINIEGNADRDEIDRAIAQNKHTDFVQSG